MNKHIVTILDKNGLTVEDLIFSNTKMFHHKNCTRSGNKYVDDFGKVLHTDAYSYFALHKDDNKVGIRHYTAYPDYILTASGPMRPTPAPAPVSGQQKWRFCVWGTKGYQGLTDGGKSCDIRTKGDGSDPSTGSNDFGPAAGMTATNFGILTKSGAPQSLLPKEVHTTWPCKDIDKAALFPEGAWAWILHGPIGMNPCTTGSPGSDAMKRFDWWLKNAYGSTPPSWSGDKKGSFTISGDYLKNLIKKVDTTAFASIDITKGFTAWASNGHGMWGGNCNNFNLALFWLEPEQKFIINMQTGPRTWSGEIVPFGGEGGYNNAWVPNGITLTGNDENGKQVDSDLDIFTTGFDGTLTLKSGITLIPPS